MFEVNIIFGWRCFLGALAVLGSTALLSLLFLLVRMHEKLNLINGLYTLLFSISAIGVPLEFYFLLQTGILADIKETSFLTLGESLSREVDEYLEFNCARYWETWAFMYALNVTILFCVMFARFVYVRYASGLIELGTRLFELLVIVSVVFLFGFFTAFALGFILKPGYPHSFIKGKLCMKQEIAEWSPTGDIDKDFSLKPKLIAWVLVFLFECGNQFFCSSASLTCHIWYAFVDQQINALMEYYYESLGVSGCFTIWWWWNVLAITVNYVLIPLYILTSSWKSFPELFHTKKPRRMRTDRRSWQRVQPRREFCVEGLRGIEMSREDDISQSREQEGSSHQFTYV